MLKLTQPLPKRYVCERAMTSATRLRWVAGRVVRDGQLVTADVRELVERVRSLVPGLFERRSAYLSTAELSPGIYG